MGLPIAPHISDKYADLLRVGELWINGEPTRWRTKGYGKEVREGSVMQVARAQIIDFIWKGLPELNANRFSDLHELRNCFLSGMVR